MALRKELDEAGHDSGAQTIAAHLERRYGRTPAVSTIWRVLVRRGFVTPQPHKRPKSSFVRFEADQPNERWQVDTTHWALADGTDVEILNQLDDHSRLIVGSDVRYTFKAADVVDCFRQATARHGLPAQMLSDNGAVFTGIPRGAGRVALELELAALGIAFRHSRPYHPQTCGKVERYHQTLKRWLARPAPSPHPTSPPSPARRLPRLLQHQPTPPRPDDDAPPPRPSPPAPRPDPAANQSPTGTTGPTRPHPHRRQ